MGLINFLTINVNLPMWSLLVLTILIMIGIFMYIRLETVNGFLVKYVESFVDKFGNQTFEIDGVTYVVEKERK